MIITLILQIVTGFFQGIYLLFSGFSTLDSHITGAITYALDSINQLNYLIPTNSLFIALAIVVTFEFGLWTFRGAIWIYRHIPFIGH